MTANDERKQLTHMRVMHVDTTMRTYYRTVRKSVDRHTANILTAGVILAMTVDGREHQSGRVEFYDGDGYEPVHLHSGGIGSLVVKGEPDG